MSRRRGIDHRLAGDAADLVQVGDARDAGRHRQKDHRRDDHLDQADETVADRLERGAESGPEMADRRTERDRRQHLDVEMRVPSRAPRGSRCRWNEIVAHRRWKSSPVAGFSRPGSSDGV
jgi:hypothetical protein